MHTQARVAWRTFGWLLVVVVATVARAAAASVDGITLHWTSAGAGPQTLMLVHGWTCDDSSWSGQVPALTTKYRVLTLDLPGHGKSGRLEAAKFSMDLFARAVEAVRAEAGADRLVLVGHSMGTPVIRQVRAALSAARDGPRDRGRRGGARRAAAARRAAGAGAGAGFG